MRVRVMVIAEEIGDHDSATDSTHDLSRIDPH
jgi:hypothetical protein